MEAFDALLQLRLRYVASVVREKYNFYLMHIHNTNVHIKLHKYAGFGEMK